MYVNGWNAQVYDSKDYWPISSCCGRFIGNGEVYYEVWWNEDTEPGLYEWIEDLFQCDPCVDFIVCKDCWKDVEPADWIEHWEYNTEGIMTRQQALNALSQ